MLEKLIVDNYLLIDHIEFDAHSQMSVFIGETGSGKSLFIESLGIILGNKFSLSNIGTFRETTMMSAIFSGDKDSSDMHRWFEEHQFTFHDEIIITRTFQKSGKSITRLNGEVVPVQVIKSLGEVLVDIHSQFDTQQLLKSSVQHASIDNHVDDALKKAYENAFLNYQEQKKQYQIFADKKSQAQDIDYLYFQKEELEPYHTYDKKTIEELESEYKQLKSQVQNQQFIEASVALLGEEGIQKHLPLLQKNIAQIKLNQKEAPQIVEMYQQLMICVDELDYALNQMLGDEVQLQTFATLEQNLQTIYKLQQKHGDDLALAYTEVLTQISQVENADQHEQKLRAAIEKSEQEAIECAKKLDLARNDVIAHIEKEMVQYFKVLHLENMHFQVHREVHPSLTRNGLSSFQFYVASNNQTRYQPLSKVVSGGELSRIMLALKAVMLQRSSMLMIFDEIDSGVSGKVAASIASVLHHLSKIHQVFLITHSPLVAVSGQHFYQIVKHIRTDKQYETTIVNVNADEINFTLAHLISQNTPSQAAIKQIEHLRKAYE